MKNSDSKLLLIELSALIILLLDIFVTNILEEYFLALFLGIIIGIVILLTGHRKDRKLYVKDCLLNIVICCITYYLITYLSGIFIGFLRSGYGFGIRVIVRNILPIVLNIVLCEYLRNEILSKINKSKILLVLTFVLFVVIDVRVIAYAYDVGTTKGLIELFYTNVLPIVSKNIFLTYLCYKFGYVPCLVYRFFMELPVYFIPIIPDIDDYIDTIINLLFPVILLFITYSGFNKVKKSDVRKERITSKVFIVVMITIISLIIIFTSGIFNYYALAIGSESMEPNLYKGDIVIVKKVPIDDFDSFKVGEILVYKHNNVVVVHRIVKITHNSSNYYFNTQGDNNTEVDPWTIDEASVIGKAVVGIPYIGIPTVWLNEKV